MAHKLPAVARHWVRTLHLIPKSTISGSGIQKIVKLCVHFVSMCLKVQKWTQTDTKSHFSHTTTTHPPGNFFLNKTFLLQWHGVDLALIKRYHPFCLFMIVYKKAKIDNPSKLSVLYLSAVFFSFCLSVFFFFLSAVFLSSSISLFSLSFFISKRERESWHYYII